MFAAALAAFGGDSGTDVEPSTFADLPETPTPEQRCCAEILLSLRAATSGRWGEAAGHVREAHRTGQQVELGEQDLLPNLAVAAMQVGDHAVAHACHQQLLTRARGSGAIVIVLYALTRLPWTGVPLGEWSDVVVQAEEAVRLAEGTGQPGLLAAPLCWLLVVSAHRADPSYDDHWSRLQPLLQEPGLGTLELLIRDVARWAQGVKASPRTPSGFHHLAQISHHTAQRIAGMDRVEAAVHAEHQETARLWIQDLEEFGAATGQTWALGVAAHGRALLASKAGVAEAEPLFEEAVRLQTAVGRPFQLARTQLAYGEHLRRARRRVAARDHLRAALEAFEDLRAAPWAERAAQELRASGETARKRDVSTATDLTPQELQVAQLVQRGLSNKDVAAQLFVSPRTVDFHLRNVFAKTGVTSRVELAQLPLT